MTKQDLAMQLKHGDAPCNCCQAVLCTFMDEIGITKEQAMRLGSTFGGGMATGRGPCGALCGAEMVIGLAGSSKLSPREASGKALDEFEEKVGSIICQEIKGTATGVALCSCDDCIKNAVAIAEEALA
jgi:C_GCAxxG_C_C family probable redox protein